MESRHIAEAIAKALDGLEIDGFGRLQVSSLGAVLGGQVVGRNSYGMWREDGIEFHAVIRSGPLDL